MKLLWLYPFQWLLNRQYNSLIHGELAYVITRFPTISHLDIQALSYLLYSFTILCLSRISLFPCNFGDIVLSQIMHVEVETAVHIFYLFFRCILKNRRSLNPKHLRWGSKSVLRILCLHKPRFAKSVPFNDYAFLQFYFILVFFQNNKLFSFQKNFMYYYFIHICGYTSNLFFF